VTELGPGELEPGELGLSEGALAKNCCYHVCTSWDDGEGNVVGDCLEAEELNGVHFLLVIRDNDAVSEGFVVWLE